MIELPCSTQCCAHIWIDMWWNICYKLTILTVDYLKNKYKKVSNTSHAIFRDILSLSDYKWLIVTNVRHGSNYAFALAVFRAPFFWESERERECWKYWIAKSVIIKSLHKKNLTYFVNGMHFWGCRIGLSRENKILEAFVIFSWKETKRYKKDSRGRWKIQALSASGNLRLCFATHSGECDISFPLSGSSALFRCNHSGPAKKVLLVATTMR